MEIGQLNIVACPMYPVIIRDLRVSSYATADWACLPT